MIDISNEIIFKTARSSGKGGQNVNKVESMVMGLFNIRNSNVLSEEQKIVLHTKLNKLLTKNGDVFTTCQIHRSQLSNKEEVLQKLNNIINRSLIIPKKRKATRPSIFSKEQAKHSKKLNAEKKQYRKRVDLRSL